MDAEPVGIVVRSSMSMKELVQDAGVAGRTRARPGPWALSERPRRRVPAARRERPPGRRPRTEPGPGRPAGRRRRRRRRRPRPGRPERRARVPRPACGAPACGPARGRRRPTARGRSGGASAPPAARRSRSRPDELAEFLELGHDDLALDPELLGELVDPDLCHVSPVSVRASGQARTVYCWGVLMAGCSSGAHQRLDPLPARTVLVRAGSCARAGRPAWPGGVGREERAEAVVSSGPLRRKARANARRRSARSRQPGRGAGDAPDRRARGADRGRRTSRPPTWAATTRSRTDRAARSGNPRMCGSARGASARSLGLAGVRPASHILTGTRLTLCRGRRSARGVGGRGVLGRRSPAGAGCWTGGRLPGAGRRGNRARPGGCRADDVRADVDAPPVSWAASRAFCPSLPIASDSW